MISRIHIGTFSAIWVATALLFAVSPLLAAGSLSGSALGAMLPFAALTAIVSLGQLLVIQQRGLDLSLPGTISLAALIVAKYPEGHDDRLAAALLLVLAMAVVVGLANGLAVTVLGITPFVATLAINAVLTGAVLSYSGGQSHNVPHALSSFAQDKWLGVSTLVFVALAVLAVLAFVLGRTLVGRRFVAVGANSEAARAVGLRVTVTQIGAYVAAGCCYALGGVLLAGFTQTPSLDIGATYLLPAIAAVVLGGTSLAGGRGSPLATVGGALFLSQLSQLVLAMGAASSTQYLIQALIIGLGMGVRNVPWNRLANTRLRRRAAA
jgi:ribose transport system permease protein